MRQLVCRIKTIKKKRDIRRVLRNKRDVSLVVSLGNLFVFKYFEAEVFCMEKRGMLGIILNPIVAFL